MLFSIFFFGYVCLMWQPWPYMKDLVHWFIMAHWVVGLWGTIFSLERYCPMLVQAGLLSHASWRGFPCQTEHLNPGSSGTPSFRWKKHNRAEEVKNSLVLVWAPPEIDSETRISGQKVYLASYPRKLQCGSEDWDRKEKAAYKGVVSGRLLPWEVGAQFHCRPLGDSLEHASELPQQGSWRICPPTPIRHPLRADPRELAPWSTGFPQLHGKYEERERPTWLRWKMKTHAHLGELAPILILDSCLLLLIPSFGE